MNDKYRVLALMTGAQAGASVIQQAVGVLAPFFIAAYAINKTQLGLLFLALFLGSSGFTAISGALTDRLGERRMVLIAGIVMSFALLAAAAVASYAWLVAWIGVFGIGYAASTPAGGRAILEWFDRDRGLAMSVRQTGVAVGGLIGALILPFSAFALGGYRAALVVAAVLVLVPTLVAFAFYRESERDRPPPARLRDILGGMRRLARDPRLVAVTIPSVLLVNVQLAMNGFLTVTAIKVLGTSAALASLAFASAFVGAMSGRLGWGWFSDRVLHGERIGLLGALCVLTALAALCIGLLGPATVGLLIPAAVFLGFCAAGWNGVMTAALAEIGGADRAGSALGLVLTAIFGASAIGPPIFGAIADHTSLDTAWLITAAITPLGAIPVLLVHARRRPVPSQR